MTFCVRSKSETKVMNVMVVDILARNKENPTVVLSEKDTNLTFKARISLDEDEDHLDAVFNETAMNIIWDSARYSNRYFWIEVSVASRQDKIVHATILAAAENKEDLPGNVDTINNNIDY